MAMLLLSATRPPMTEAFTAYNFANKSNTVEAYSLIEPEAMSTCSKE
jgi:hypothetical protein